MRALQFATATANLASQNACLFLAIHGPIFNASSSSATLIQRGFQYCRWNLLFFRNSPPAAAFVVLLVCSPSFGKLTGTVG
jgi:hypothetical protein